VFLTCRFKQPVKAGEDFLPQQLLARRPDSPQQLLAKQEQGRGQAKAKTGGLNGRECRMSNKETNYEVGGEIFEFRLTIYDFGFRIGICLPVAVAAQTGKLTTMAREVPMTG